MNRDDAEIELASLLLERRRLARLNLAPAPNVLERIRSLELYLFGVARMTRSDRTRTGAAVAWARARAEEILRADSPLRLSRPNVVVVTKPSGSDDFDRKKIHAAILQTTGNKRTGLYTEQSLSRMSEGAVREIARRLGVLPPPVPVTAPTAQPPSGADPSAPDAAPERAAPREVSYSAVDEWASSHADRHADEMAQKFGWDRARARKVLHHAILSTAMRATETGGGVRGGGTFGGKRVKVNVKKLPEFRNSRRFLVKFSNESKTTQVQPVTPVVRPNDLIETRRPSDVEARDRERVRAAQVPEHPIAEDLRLFRQHVRSLHATAGAKGVRPNTPEEHALLADFARQRGLKVKKSAYTYYEEGSHTLYHPTPEDRYSVGAAYVKQGTGGVRFSRREVAARFAKKPAPNYPEIVRHAAAAMDAPHDDTAIRSFADHLAEAHPGPLADDFHRWVNGDATHHILEPHVAPRHVAMYHLYGPNNAEGTVAPEYAADVAHFEMRQRISDSPRLLPWYGRNWDHSGWTLRKPAPWAHPFSTVPVPRRCLLPTVEVARQLYENVGPHALVAAIVGLRHYRPENAENHDRPTGSGINFSRRVLVSRRRFGKTAGVYRPTPLTDPAQLFPQENADVASMKPGSISKLNTNIRQSTGNKEGTLPTLSEVTALAHLGEPVRGSYEDQREVMTELLRTPADAERWATINAILSANSAFEAHSKDSLRGFTNWVSVGRPTDPAGLDKVFGTTERVTEKTPTGTKTATKMLDWGMWPQKGTPDATMSVWGDKVEKIKRFLSAARQSVYTGGVHWSDISEGSYKTPNFGLSFNDPRGTALDTHMARLLVPGRPFHRSALYHLAAGTGSAAVISGIKNARDKVVQRGLVYIAYKTLLGHAAKELGWSPREVQETVWTALMAIMAAKGHDPKVREYPTAVNIVRALDRNSVAKGWDLTGFLTDPGVLASLELVGVKSKELSNVAKRARQRRDRRAGTGPVAIPPSDRPAVETVAGRLEPADQRTAAAQPILSALRARGYGRRKPDGTKANRSQKQVKRYALVNRHDFLGALRRMASANHSDFVKRVESVATRMGMHHTKALPALHDAPTGAVPGVAQAVYGESPAEKVSALAAWVNGLLPNGPGYAVFHVRPGGPDTLYRMRHDGSGMDVRSKLDRAGIRSRIMIPHRRGFDVIVPDVGNKLTRAVEGYAQQHGLSVEASPGHFQTAGSATDQGQSRETFRNDVVRGEQFRRGHVNMTRYARPVPHNDPDFLTFWKQLTGRKRTIRLDPINPGEFGPDYKPRTRMDGVSMTTAAPFEDWLNEQDDWRHWLVRGLAHYDIVHRSSRPIRFDHWFVRPDRGRGPEIRLAAGGVWNLPNDTVVKHSANIAGLPTPFTRLKFVHAEGNSPVVHAETWIADDKGRLRTAYSVLTPEEYAGMREQAATAGATFPEPPATHAVKPQQFARKKGHIWFRLIGAARKAVREVNTGPDYQRLFWHEGKKHAHWVSADGDEEKHVRHIKRSLGKVRGVNKVTADAESWPKEEGWKEIPVKRGSKVVAK